MKDMPVIYRYTRAQAITEGELVDVTATAARASFLFPVAVTRALDADIRDIPESNHDDYDTRLWDVLWMRAAAVKGALPAEKQGPGTLVYELDMPVADRATRSYRVKAVCGPGDTAEPVITLMKPDED